MQQVPSVYHIGAKDGLIMGLILSAIFLSQALSATNPALSLIGTVLMLAVPFVAYAMIRRGYKASQGVYTISAMWMHGIMTFICGSLIMALVMYVYTRVINPLYIVGQVEMVAQLYREVGTDEALKMAGTLERIISQHMLPTPIGLAFAMIWAVSFSGALLSLVIALIIKLTSGRKPSSGQYLR